VNHGREGDSTLGRAIAIDGSAAGCQAPFCVEIAARIDLPNQGVDMDGKANDRRREASPGRYKVCDEIERVESQAAERSMFASRSEFADMQLAKRGAELVQHANRGCHRGIDLTNMTEIEAESGVGIGAESISHFGNGPAGRLSIVHVLEAQTAAEGPPETWSPQKFGVHDERPRRW